ncbi:MAG: universal stress protein [Gemmatimonadota bacterium]|nr:universal stress protein [Gemmatimonadota bacterium]
MIARILVPIDGSAHSSRAAEFATELAVRFEASLTFLHVLDRVVAREQLKRYLAHLESAREPDQFEIESVEKTLARSGETEGRQLLDHLKSAAEAAGVREVDTSLLDGQPARVIVGEAESGGYDLVVLGRRGAGGLKGLLAGSVSQRVASAASATVVMVN